MTTARRIAGRLAGLLLTLFLASLLVFFSRFLVPGDPIAFLLRGRKPSPQFLLDARDELGLDLAASYMIGDKLIDLECGWNAGVKRAILVRTGYGEQTLREATSHPDHVVNDLREAAAVIQGLLRSRPDCIS